MELPELVRSEYRLLGQCFGMWIMAQPTRSIRLRFVDITLMLTASGRTVPALANVPTRYLQPATGKELS